MIHRWLNNRPSRLTAYGILCCFSFMGLCVLIIPEGLTANYGMSYYGSFVRTLIPYMLGAVLGSLCFFYAAQALQDARGNAFTVLTLRITSLCVILIAATPHNIVSRQHMIVGSLLFAYQLVFTIWIIVTKPFRWYRYILFLLQLGSGVAAAYYIPREHGYLLESQFVFQLTFFLLLISLLRHHTRIFAQKKGSFSNSLSE